MSILCVGEMVADIVVRPVPADVQQRDSTIVEEISVVNGGDALNTAVGLGRLGHDVAFIGKAGKDDFGRMLVDIARNAGVDVSHVKVSQIYDNSKVVALISADGQRSFLHCPGSNQEFSADDIEEDVLRGKNVFHIGGTFHLPPLTGKRVLQAFWRELRRLAQKPVWMLPLTTAAAGWKRSAVVCRIWIFSCPVSVRYGRCSTFRMKWKRPGGSRKWA